MVFRKTKKEQYFLKKLASFYRLILVIFTFTFFLILLTSASLTAFGWETTVKGRVTAPLAVSRQHLFAAADNGYVYAFSLDDGSIAWQKKVSGIRSGVFCENQMLYIISSGNIISLDENSGTENWIFRSKMSASQINFYYFPSIAVSSDHIYFNLPQGYLYSIRKSDGEADWKQDIRPPQFYSIASQPSAVAVSGSLVFTGCYNGEFICMSAAGDKVWSHDTEATFFSNPVFSKNNVVVGSDNNYIYSFNQEDGNLNWQYAVDNKPVFLSVHDENIVAVLENGFVLVLNTQGKQKWKYSSPAGFLSQAVFSDSGFFTGGNDGKLRLFSLTGENRINWIYSSKSNYITAPAVNNNDIYFSVVNFDKNSSKIMSTSKDGFFVTINDKKPVAFAYFPFLPLLSSAIKQSKALVGYQSGYIKPVKYFSAPFGAMVGSINNEKIQGISFKQTLLSLTSTCFLAVLVLGPFGFAVFVFALLVSLIGHWANIGFFASSTSVSENKNVKNLFIKSLKVFKTKNLISIIYFAVFLCLLAFLNIFTFSTASFFMGAVLFSAAAIMVILGSFLKALTINYFNSSSLTASFNDTFTNHWKSLFGYYFLYFLIFTFFIMFIVFLSVNGIFLFVLLSMLAIFTFFFGAVDLYASDKDSGVFNHAKESIGFILQRFDEKAAVYLVSTMLVLALTFAGVFLLKTWAGTIIESFLLAQAFGFINSLVWVLETK